MEWLQNNHPDLYTCCSDSIVTIDEGIFINDKGLPLQQYKELMSAAEQYNNMTES